ncbi:MAG TPA: SAM-dependent methyltransferase [Thermoplasmata archaeon]|nr:SAM-dependent methyltransferase [Thermoplasmata archaeon]
MTEPARAAPSVDVHRRERIRDRLRGAAYADGFVPFDRFMDIALYGDGVGFYSREDSPFGREGDYYTAAHASPLFGRAIAERIRTVASGMPAGAPFRVLEVGPGDGTLGETVLTALGLDAGLRRRLEYVLVERSPTLGARAFERISAAGHSVGIPVSATGAIGAEGPFRGVVVANEVLDAQPARRLLWNGEEWQELGVRLADDGFVVSAAPLLRPVPAPALPRPTEGGVILEVSPMAEGLVREVADHLVAGLFLMIDYGMEEAELLAAHPSGTLAAVRRHRPTGDPIADPGESDLSVFVNFTRIRAAAKAAGLIEIAFRRQAEALGTWGFPQLLEEAIRSASSSEIEVRVRLAAKNLLFGFDRFYALELTPPSDERGAPNVT